MSEDETDGDWFESAVGSEASGDGADQGASDDERPEDDGTSGEEGQDSPFEDGSDGTSDDGKYDSPFEGEEDAASSDGTDSPFEGGDASLGDVEGGAAFDPDDGGSPFGGDDESLFEEDFTDAFASAGGAGGSEFEDEDFESAIPRIDLGIEGLDGMIQGGVPERHLMVAIGSAGTGKTTFGLQFLHHGLERGESCVFITLEQTREAIMATAKDRDWAFDRYAEEDRLAVIDLDPVEMANSLDNIRDELPGLIAEFSADRLVLDSVSLLEMMYDDQAERRTEVYDFTRSLKKAGVTTMLTSEASEDNPYASRHGIIEYLTDAVFVLQYVRSNTQETRLAVEIMKIRDANHSRETNPYEITMDGIDVYRHADIL
ncbi:KaiC domain-containing protein [Halomicrobium salinisoli]|uniref:KaiC domain-containing protein n=1 Tax=Halomicrobium salinisoli TaxID=2878391 RepID=UPI001CEFDA9A|nr:KaiC domain-containing protein [Halomicrobium salinisoli]